MGSPSDAGPQVAAGKKAVTRAPGRASIHSLRWYISVGFLLVGVVPLVIFGAQRISALFQTQNESIQQKHEPMAESLAQAVYGYLLDQTAALQSTASQIESAGDSTVSRLNDPSFNPAPLNQELAAAHSAQPALLQLYVGNLAGRAVAADPPAGVGVDYSAWNYVKDVLNPRRSGPKYSDVVHSQGDASVAAVVIAVPIYNLQRSLVGYLAGTVELSEVQRLSRYSQIGANGQAVVVDSRGRVIAHPRTDWRLEAKDLSSEAIFQQSLGQETGVSWYTDLDGNVPRAAGFATVPVVNWKVWVSQPVADLRSELTPLILSTLEWLLVTVVLALLLAFLAAAWITRPVGELTRAASRIAQGDFITPVKVRKQFAARELQALAQTFNQMSRQLSGAYQTLEEKVLQRTSELQAANQEMARANKLKSEFLANVSHELRTPLSAIIGFSQILLDGIDGPLNDDQQQDIEQVNKSGQSLLTLINQILDLSKIEAGKMELTIERLELPALIDSVLESISPLAQEKGLRIQTQFATNLPAVEADALRLKQILINLLSNAVKFTERGQIEVSAQPSGRMVRIAVKDTGIGISADAQKVIFDEFVQGDGSSTRRHGGTGLGLSIVRRLVEMHGGAITVVSEPGMGSTFTFTVPGWATAANTPTAAATTTRLRAVHKPDQGLPGSAILVVDDDPSVRQLIARHLEQDGWKTVQASNATDALQLAHEVRPVLITLDIMMPDASGWWVLEKLKEDPQTAGIPVLVVTIVEDQRLIFALGASDYLAKPYERAALIDKIHHLLPQVEGRRVLVVDDDPDARAILCKILKEEHASVVAVPSGDAAMSAIAEAPPDLVLLDLMMPGMSGFETVARMRALPAAARIPVMIVSAKELTPEDVLTLNGHVQRFVAKGAIEPEGLTAAVRQVLGQSDTQGVAA